MIKAKPPIAQGLCSIMYGTAARIGELIHYNHSYKVIKRDGNKRYWTGEYRRKKTEGLRKSEVRIGRDGILITLNNFKNRKREEKEVYISNKREAWLCELIKNYVANHKDGYLFPMYRNTAMTLVKNSIGITSHNLRHSRLTHLVRHFGFSNYEIKETAGHASLETSSAYVHLRPGDIKHKLENPVIKEGME